jgi:hypothetical protein
MARRLHWKWQGWSLGETDEGRYLHVYMFGTKDGKQVLYTMLMHATKPAHLNSAKVARKMLEERFGYVLAARFAGVDLPEEVAETLTGH